MNLRILSALAKIADVQNFRLRDFMSQLNMDIKQPALFYRQLIKEARELVPLVDQLQQRLAVLEYRQSDVFQYEIKPPLFALVLIIRKKLAPGLL